SSGQSAAMLSVPPPSWLRRRGAAHERTRVALLEEPAMSSPTGNVAPIGGALTMAKTPKELEQIHEHNRKVLRELQFDSTKWLPVPRAIRALVPVFEPALQAAAELHKLMRSPSGAIPTATRWGRWRDGLQTSHIITRYPAPADWDAVSPESLLQDFREISEGDGNVVRCWDYVDLHYFNTWLSTLTERTTPKKRTPLEERRAAFERALHQDTSPQRQVARAILKKKNPGDYFHKSPAVLLKQVQNEKTWKAECEAQGFDPTEVKP